MHGHESLTFLHCLTKRLEYIVRRYLLPLKGIQRLHAFRDIFGDTYVVFVKTGSDDIDYRLKVCRVAPPRDALTVLHPVGLSIHVHVYEVGKLPLQGCEALCQVPLTGQTMLRPTRPRKMISVYSA